MEFMESCQISFYSCHFRNPIRIFFLPSFFDSMYLSDSCISYFWKWFFILALLHIALYPHALHSSLVKMMAFKWMNLVEILFSERVCINYSMWTPYVHGKPHNLAFGQLWAFVDYVIHKLLASRRSWIQLFCHYISCKIDRNFPTCFHHQSITYSLAANHGMQKHSITSPACVFPKWKLLNCAI